MSGTRLEQVLSKQAAHKFRNVRAVAVLYVVLGTILLLGGLGSFIPDPDRGSVNPVVGIIAAVVGLSGVVGGGAVISRNRRLAPAVYVIAVVYLLALPVGTVLSILMLMGLSGHLRSCDLLAAHERAAAGVAP